jgi:hypothetical protein
MVGPPSPLPRAEPWLLAADMDAGFERLQRRGLMTDNEELTEARRAFREEIEVRTDELERPLLDALGDDLDELLGHLDPWSEAIVAAGSYPQRVAGIYTSAAGRISAPG